MSYVCDMRTAGSRKSESEYDGRFTIASPLPRVVARDVAESPADDPAARGGINARFEGFLDDGALYELAVAGRLSPSLTGEEAADALALLVFNSSFGVLELPLVPACVREELFALPSSDGLLDEGVVAFCAFPSGALPVEIVARLACLGGLGGSLGASSEVVEVALGGLVLCGGNVLMTVCEEPYSEALAREFSAPAI